MVAPYCDHGTQRHKQRRVAGDMKIEIAQAVQKQAADPHQGREFRRTDRIQTPAIEVALTTAVKRDQEPEQHQSAHSAQFGERLKIIVMRGADYLIAIEA